MLMMTSNSVDDDDVEDGSSGLTKNQIFRRHFPKLKRRELLLLVLVISLVGLKVASTQGINNTLRAYYTYYEQDQQQQQQQQQQGRFALETATANTTEIDLRPTRPDWSTAKPMHLLLSLSGNAQGFFDEVELLLKSVLMNAPEYASLTIHIMADGPAILALNQLFERTELHLWQSRNPVVVRTYNCALYVDKWRRKIQGLYLDGNATNTTIHVKQRQANHHISYHTIGTWFRLLAHEVLPSSVEHVLYVDSDVVILANLQELWNHVDPDAYFQMGESFCAGFMILNVPKIPEMWREVEAYGWGRIAAQIDDKADQLFLKGFRLAHTTTTTTTTNDPNQTTTTTTTTGRNLPNSWDNSLANGLYLMKKNLVSRRPQIGYIHFNGGANSKSAWFKKGKWNEKTKSGEYSDWITGEHTWKTFGLVDYYIRMTWTWARFFALAKIPSEEGSGHAIDIITIIVGPA